MQLGSWLEKSQPGGDAALDVAANPNSCGARWLQELKQSAPAAHVFSVCAYFPNLDMGSELQAPRLYVKLAWLPPFRSPSLAAAQRRDALCRWDYCRQPAAENLRPWGRPDQKVSWHSSHVLALPGAFAGSSRGKEKSRSGPFAASGRHLAPALRSRVGLGKLSAALLSSFGWRTAASEDGGLL